jgi:PhzF family phenazine biosynthesis protein
VTHTLYQVDAFATRLFEGNPAAVMILDEFLPDDLLQEIAAENNLAETAYAVRTGESSYDLRWFTPGAEVPLCGHATLATAHVLFAEEGLEAEAVSFRTRKSGVLTVRREGEGYAMDLPAVPPRRIDPPAGLAEALGVEPSEVHDGQYLMAVLPDEASVRGLRPSLLALAEVRGPGEGRSVDADCVFVTAPGEEHDFVSRFFGPKVGIPEDPVTGSAHCMMTPYWAERLGRTELSAYQASPRGGRVGCRLEGDRVVLTGGAVTYLRGEVRL